MILINSASYVVSDLQVEFGRIPPSFLPVGNRRLWQVQVRTMHERFRSERLYLSLPCDFQVGERDLEMLGRHDVSLILNDPDLDLATSVAQSLDQMDLDEASPLRLLHGDTFIGAIPQSENLIAIAESNHDHAWEVEEPGDTADSVWCGYFCLDDALAFAGLLHRPNSTFVKAMRAYDEHEPLTRVRVSPWFDFGHANTYFLCRAEFATQREFNSLDIDNGVVRKSGYPASKIDSERIWYQKVPTDLVLHTPRLLRFGTEGGSPFYEVEYLFLPPLNEVFVHGSHKAFYWCNVFRLCDEFLNKCAGQALTERVDAVVTDTALAMLAVKTWARLIEYTHQVTDINLDVPTDINGRALPSLRDITKTCIDMLDQKQVRPGFLHGDFCLSNILYDSRADRILVIDPRGMDVTGSPTPAGDLQYDLAKLSHSVIGLYDHIMAGAYDVECGLSSTLLSFQLEIQVDAGASAVQSIFLDRPFLETLRPRSVMPMTVLLFMGMLPLHSDDPKRQTALLANALRLYDEYVLPGTPAA